VTARFLLATALILPLPGCRSAPTLEPWHTVRLTEEFTARKADHVQSFAEYGQLEDRLFAELDAKVYSRTESGPAYAIHRYSAGSAADPRSRRPDWNRSFDLPADETAGGVLLLHGMSDSPYALRAVGEALNRRNYRVIGLRMPGHGTAPSGLKYISPDDMAAAVRVGMRHLASEVGPRPIHIVGYSTGAPLALHFALDALEGAASPVPSSLILISPAIGVHAVAALAGFKAGLGRLPGFDGLAFLAVQPEFDPYKYNSFATNAANVVHRLTRSLARRIRARARSHPDDVLPPTLVFKSAVDATVTTAAVADDLLVHLAPHRHEMILFDINRYAVVTSKLLIDDPAPLTDRLLNDATLPFAVTLVSNRTPETTAVASKTKTPFSAEMSGAKALDLAWPPGVISLSHLALAIPPDDPLYGQRAPENEDFLFLGQMAFQGERGLLKVPADWMLRLRYNPFYDYLETRLLDWVDDPGAAAAAVRRD
jgi:alpha-beta hydrolase superfamily lysophospholipase